MITSKVMISSGYPFEKHFSMAELALRPLTVPPSIKSQSSQGYAGKTGGIEAELKIALAH
jgi:hypothetical protein